MHSKEQLAREAFEAVLGATVTAPDAINTDQFGTFSGEIPRTLAPSTAARAKAQLGMHIAGTRLGMASEGSFIADFGISVTNTELLLFIDTDRGFEIVESVSDVSAIPGGRTIETVDAAATYANAIGFPGQGLIVRTPTTVHKNFATRAELLTRIEALLDDPARPRVTLEPDYRAHLAPARAEVIATLCHRMATRLATPCAACGTPGFGRVGVEPGLPCRECGSATQLIRADLHGCAICDHRVRVPRPEASAAAHWCDDCNP